MIPDTIAEQMDDLYYRIAEVERRARNRKRTGTIADVDHDKGLYRVKLSEQGAKPFLTDWLKTRQLAAGGVKIDVLLSQGEQVDVVSESGDLTDAQIDLSSYSESNQRANSDTPLLIRIGDAMIAMSGSDLVLKAGTIRLEGKVHVVGEELRHNTRNIGDDHTHKDVRSGTEFSGPPKE